MTTGLFEGLRILELGQYVAAPYAAELFAHGGADVIKVEPVTGDATRYNSPLGPDEGRQYIVKARGKRGIPVDLGTEAGRAIARDLALSSDAVITNMRPGVAERLGLDFDTLRSERPSIVFGQISGFGDTGPLASRASVDMIAQSWSGLNASVGASHPGPPRHHEAFLCDYTAGVLLAFGIAAALRSVALGQPGQKVTTSLAQAALVLQHRNANVFEGIDAWKSEVRGWVEEDGLQAALERRATHNTVDPFFFTSYSTTDGVVGVGAVGTMAATMCGAFGIIDPRSKPEWGDRSQRQGLFDQAKAELAELFSGLTSAHVEERLVALGIPASRFRLLEEVMYDPEAEAGGLIHTWQHPTLGEVRMPSAPVDFSGADYEANETTPAIGAHTDEILRDLGYDDGTIERLIADGIVRRAD
jgi:formyl-CoA transferase